MSKAYEASGVSLEAGYESVRRIKKHMEATKNKGVMDLFGSFGGMFDLSSYGYREPVLVSGTDGVGTKLKIGIELDIHDTLGIDLVAMCVNDILTQGATPLFFLDYIACGKNEPQKIEGIVHGVSQGCIESGMALIGGETAEMPGMYAPDDYDLAGFCVGAVEKSKLITGENVEEGQVMIGLPSSGIHSNGYSLVRKVLADQEMTDLSQYYDILGETLGEALLRPTRIYVQPVLKLLDKIDVKGMVHITGGGFYENIPRILPRDLGVEIQTEKMEIPPIIKLLAEKGDLKKEDLYSVFNMGIGYIIIVDEKDRDSSIAILKEAGESPVILGKVTGEKGVTID